MSDSFEMLENNPEGERDCDYAVDRILCELETVGLRWFDFGLHFCFGDSSVKAVFLSTSKIYWAEIDLFLNVKAFLLKALGMRVERALIAGFENTFSSITGGLDFDRVWSTFFYAFNGVFFSTTMYPDLTFVRRIGL